MVQSDFPKELKQASEVGRLVADVTTRSFRKAMAVAGLTDFQISTVTLLAKSFMQAEALTMVEDSIKKLATEGNQDEVTESN